MLEDKEVLRQDPSTASSMTISVFVSVLSSPKSLGGNMNWSDARVRSIHAAYTVGFFIVGEH